MDEYNEFNHEQGLYLAISYVEDPSSVSCPVCGPGFIEVVSFLDPDYISEGRAVPKSPDDNYIVVLYCHKCNKSTALDILSD